ncbi:hypothetical protein BKA93DRAFT_506562 [Sparassis latifolia]
MISIGGVVRTGLFFGSAVSSRSFRKPWYLTQTVQDALHHGGPVGALLGYAIIGSVMYSLCISIREMIAFLWVLQFNAAILGYLGFSLGRASWYSWSIILRV